MAENEHSKLFAVDKDKIFILRGWYQDASRKNYAFKKAEITDNLTDTEWHQL